MNIECPACNQLLEVPDGLVDGQHIECPYCQHKFLYAEKGGADEIKIPPHPVKAAQPPPVQNHDSKCYAFRIHCIIAFICGTIICYKVIVDELYRSGIMVAVFAIGIYLMSKLLIINLFDKDK